MTKPTVFNYKYHEELRQAYKELLADNQQLIADNRKLRQEVTELKQLNDGYVKIIAKNQETNNKLMVSVQKQTGGDYISRADAEVVSTDAVQAHGKWQRFNDEHGTCWTGCSNCKGDIPKDKYGIDMYTDFCPNCGADMRETK